MPAAQSAAARDRARDQGQGRDDGRGRASGGAVEEEEGWADGGDQGRHKDDLTEILPIEPENFIVRNVILFGTS